MKRVWLTKDDVIGLHEEALAEFGGRGGIRDVGLLESALAKPRSLIVYGRTRSVFDLAAAYCIGIARNHPFVDGNKRTAFLTAAVFLDLNSYTIASEEAEVVEKMIQVAEGGLDQARLSIWLKSVAIRK
jgi:death on curing protein